MAPGALGYKYTHILQMETHLHLSVCITHETSLNLLTVMLVRSREKCDVSYKGHTNDTELYHHHPCLILIMTVFPVVRHIMLSWPISSLCPSQGWKYSLGCLPISTHYKSLLLQYFAASHLKLPNYCNIIYFVGTNTTFVLARS